jgi:hypothetical protein
LPERFGLDRAQLGISFAQEVLARGLNLVAQIGAGRNLAARRP